MEQYSVLMSVYYRERPEYLHIAISSMLCQTVPPEEFVLVCDGKLTAELDGTIAAFCQQYPELFRVVRLEENVGLGRALNAGLAHCRNALVARMDSDDIALPRRMEQQLRELEMHPEISVLGGQIAEFDRDPEQITGCRIVPIGDKEIRSFLSRRSPMNHTTTLLRRHHILAVGGYPGVPGFEDYMLWAAMVSAGYRLRNIPAVCCRVRADAGMYCRRGGLQYFRNTLKMERYLLEKKQITRLQFWENVLIRFLGTLVLTPKLRRLVFLCFLRTKEAPSGKCGISGIREPAVPCELAGQTYLPL